MRELSLRPRGDLLKVLAVGAHSDDIEIGCGATIVQLADQYPAVHVDWVVLTADGQRRDEAQDAAEALLAGTTSHSIHIENFRGSYLPAQWAAVKDRFEEFKPFDPDLVLVHSRRDAHQDHRTVGELAWNTFRDHLVLEYEIPKYDGDLGAPSLFVPVSEAAMERKIDTLMNVFRSQHSRSWFTADTFASLMRLRGVECNSPSGYAEAFYVRKLVLGPTLSNLSRNRSDSP
ncbi:MAG: PIG-L domain-containing protein [Actinomycetales bacterium]|nr:MAG: PIG-L domain-containing protein [Actinomycetales bacterium]